MKIYFAYEKVFKNSMHPFFSINPVLLAPLAGVSDHPFRRINVRHGADLTYVEMISAAALIHNSQRTFDMLARHEDESKLGVQITGRSAEETAKGVRILSELKRFDTIDINMGCPVQKVVKNGCGSAILKDPERVFKTIQYCKSETDLPLSAKIRIGWDRSLVNGVEVAKAIEEAGADWITVHGRTRSEDYGHAVDLEAIANIKAAVSDIPVFGNGNLFGKFDSETMQEKTKVDGWMVSRGSLGDPWVFERIKGTSKSVSLDDWASTFKQHILWHAEAYGYQGSSAIAFRKHLLWYAKGFPSIKNLRENFQSCTDLNEALLHLDRFYAELQNQGVKHRDECEDHVQKSADRFRWDPKFEMDRKLDRGVGDDGLELEISP